MPSLYPSFFNSKNLFPSLSSFLCMHAYIESSGFIGGKGPRFLKIVILPDEGQSVNLDFVFYLRPDIVHKGLHALMKH